jgi:hypothetical protein
VAVIATFNATSVALFVGLVDVTVGATMGEISLPPFTPPPHAVNSAATSNKAPCITILLAEFICCLWLFQNNY